MPPKFGTEESSPTHRPSSIHEPRCSAKWPYSSGRMMDWGTSGYTRIRAAAKKSSVRADVRFRPTVQIVVKSLNTLQLHDILPAGDLDLRNRSRPAYSEAPMNGSQMTMRRAGKNGEEADVRDVLDSIRRIVRLLRLSSREAEREVGLSG